jgi:uncharacterized membrane protein YhhN
MDTSAPLLPSRGRPLLWAYIVVSVANVVGQWLAADLLMVVTKPLLMPLLLAWAWRAAERPFAKPVKLLLVGVAFAWLADLLLMPEGDLWFMAGLVGFLVMQVFYIAAYRSVPGPGLVRQRPWLLIVFVGYGVGMNLLLDPGDLRIPVVLYSVVLLGMGVFAVDLVARLPVPFGARVAVGAIAFIVSDTFLALGEFSDLAQGSFGDVIVMATYTVAQFLIVTGLVLGVGWTAEAGPSTVARTAGG